MQPFAALRFVEPRKPWSAAAPAEQRVEKCPVGLAVGFQPVLRLECAMAPRVSGPMAPSSGPGSNPLPLQRPLNFDCRHLPSWGNRMRLWTGRAACEKPPMMPRPLAVCSVEWLFIIHSTLWCDDAARGEAKRRDDLRRRRPRQPRLVVGESDGVRLARRVQPKPGSREWFDAIDARMLHAHRLFAHSREPYDRIIPLAEIAGKRVLEIGCGMGLHTETMLNTGAELTSVDITDTAIETTRRRLELKGLSGDLRRCDAEALPFQTPPSTSSGRGASSTTRRAPGASCGRLRASLTRRRGARDGL